MATMTLTRALSRVKILEGELQRSFQMPFDVFVISDIAKIEAAKREQTAEYDRWNSLYNEFNTLKELINKKNHETQVEIAGIKGSIAQIIVLKQSIQWKLAMLTNTRAQFNSAISKKQTADERLAATIDSNVRAIVGKEGNENDYEAVYADVEKTNKARLEPVLASMFGDVEQTKILIDEKIEQIKQFIAEVDYVLSEVNATTLIEL